MRIYSDDSSLSGTAAMHCRYLRGASVLAAFVAIAGDLTAADVKPAKPASGVKTIPTGPRESLEEAGLKVTSSSLSLPEEQELGKAIREMAKQKKAMMLADREIFAAQRDIDALKAEHSRLVAQHKNLSIQLSHVTDVATNNRIVGAANATAAELTQLREHQTQYEDRLAEARKKAAALRDGYLLDVLDLRAKANAVTEKWAALAADAKLKDAVGAINEALGTKLSLGPAASFAANLKQLKIMEDAITSEAIRLDKEHNTLWVDVTINGTHRHRMIVDSGANTVTLSDKAARDMGIKVDGSGEPMNFQVADGSVVSGMIIKLDSVRVGRFTVEDVECCVLGPEARNAPLLLGMTFLGQFKFEVDANQSELKLLKVDSGEPPPKEKKPPARKKR